MARVAATRGGTRAGDRVAAPRCPLEVVAVWLMFAVVAGEILATYARLPAYELYHVTGSGLTGGASRALVFANFPTALVAIAVFALLADRMSQRVVTAAAVVGTVLCSAVFWPGVVNQDDLDAKQVNALAAIGVLVALVLTGLALREGVEWSGRRPGDRVRLVVAAAVVCVGLPWFAAELGFFLNGVPGLGRVFETGHYLPPPAPPAVHHGHHHGMDGVLLVLTAALLTRIVSSIRRPALRVVTRAYLALMAAYGIANIANDAWTEQVVKRGWTSWQVPDVLRPSLTFAWGAIILGAALLYAASERKLTLT